MFKTVRRWIFSNPMFAAALAVLAGYWSIVAVVAAVDPYDVYPWGAQVKVPGNYAPFDMPSLVRAAARDTDSELVLIGSSPTTIFTQQDIAAAYPGYAKPWNVSYHGATATDRAQLIDQFVRYSRARRYLITLDYFYAKRVAETRPMFPSYLYDGDPTNDVRMINRPSLKAVLSVLRGGSPLTNPRDPVTRERAFHDEERAKFQNIAYMRSIRDRIGRHRPTIAQTSDIACAGMPALSSLIGQVRALTSKGARVDILIPPYALASYYDWAGDPTLRKAGGATLLSDQLAMRRCAVLGVASIPNAHVYSIDLDFELAGDLANFRDSTHIESPVGLSRFINMANDPGAELTPDNIDEYVTALRNAVVGYRYKNTKIPLAAEH